MQTKGPGPPGPQPLLLIVWDICYFVGWARVMSRPGSLFQFVPHHKMDHAGLLFPSQFFSWSVAMQ